MPMAPLPGSGFSANWPYAQSMPLPSAILRPLQQPLYDTEILPAAGTPSELIFFQRQLGQTTTYGGITKTVAETNLQQPGQLANPLEFSLFAFNFEIEPGTTAVDYIAIFKTSAYTFTYTGNRIYLQLPLSRIPQGVGPDGFTGVAATTFVHNGVGHISNQYKFTIGRSALRIRPTESFQAKISYPNGAPVISANTRLRVFINGLQWTPL